MKRQTRCHSTLAALLVVAVILVAGGAAIASNAGFKFNMPLVPLSGVGGQQGHNWVGVPYFNPYADRDAFCDACGLTGSGATIQTIDTNANPEFQVCGFADLPLWSSLHVGPDGGTYGGQPGEGFRVTEPNPAVTNCIVVGSHDPGLQIKLPMPASMRPSPGNFADAGKYWFSVPYHATATTRDELCIQLGIDSTSSVIQSIDPVTGNPNTQLCGFAPEALVLGQALRISAHDSGITFTPAHF